MFTAKKAVQIAAFFARQHGGKINILKLQKLMYLADRESMRQHGFPISFDRFVSMNYGPVLIGTLNLINGAVEGPEGAQWEEWLSDRSNHDVSLNRTFELDDLDQLSEADLQVMDDVWREFGKMDKWSLVDYTHAHCTEWSHSDGGLTPITYREVLEAVGIAPDEAAALDEDINIQRTINKVFKDADPSEPRYVAAA